MKIVILENKVIYRADEGKEVRFKNTKRSYSEISIPKDDKREVEEVDNGIA